jgi:GTP diphosphokinase / guanosine-3',5'-bis(diphosphate) 3'-diphosphatase
VSRCEVFLFADKPLVRRGGEIAALADSDLANGMVARGLLRALAISQPVGIDCEEFRLANQMSVTRGVVDQVISDLRKRLGHDAIITHQGDIALSGSVLTDFAVVKQALRDGGDRRLVLELTVGGRCANGAEPILQRLSNPEGPESLQDLVDIVEGRTRTVVRDFMEEAIEVFEHRDVRHAVELVRWLVGHAYLVERIQVEGLVDRMVRSGVLTERPGARGETTHSPRALTSVARPAAAREGRRAQSTPERVVGVDQLRTGRACRVRDATWRELDVAEPAIELAGTDGLPPFVGRGEAEELLREQVRAGLERHGPSMIVATGPPRAGKTRLLYEVLRSECPLETWLIAPWNGRMTITNSAYLPGSHAALRNVPRDDPVVLWLSDIERFVGVGGDGLNSAHIAELEHEDRAILIMGATGGKGEQDRDPANADVLKQFLARCDLPVRVDWKLTDEELTGLHPIYQRNTEMEARIRAIGLGPFVVAAPEMAEAFEKGRHAAFSHYPRAAVQDGLALVDGLLAWSFCCTPDPVGDDIAHELWRLFRGLRGRRSPESPDAWSQAAECASTEIVPGYSLARWSEMPLGWEPDTLLLNLANQIELVDRLLSLGVDLLESWAVTDPRARFFTIAFNAQVRRPDLAEAWYRRAIQAGDTKARNNLGVLLSEQPGREPEAEDLLRQAMANAHPEARRNLIRLLDQRGQSDEAEALRQQEGQAPRAPLHPGQDLTGGGPAQERGRDGEAFELTETERRLLDDLFAIVEEHADDSAAPIDRARVEEAFVHACVQHADQRRRSGEDFIVHPVGVAKICAAMRLDTETLCAALLHDMVEDTSASLEEVREAFGEEIAGLVDGVTRLTGLTFQSRDEAQAEKYRKMMVAMATDVRVILIKLADRLHNMRTIGAMAKQKQIEKARETLDIYAPIARRLGIHAIWWELEDLAFQTLHPRKYNEIKDLVGDSREERERYLTDASTLVNTELEQFGLRAEISGRARHFYSIYAEMTKHGHKFNEVYDLSVMTVIVGSVKDCYGAVGVIHSVWKPLPGRFKDFIAMPKVNMYQSLHTTVVGPEGRLIGIHIRTPEMHDLAEYGIAASWTDQKMAPGSRRAEGSASKLKWLRSLLDWQEEADTREFMETLKVDLFEDEVFVFTPKGEVKSLASGATPLDFAYEIHTDVGHRCVGAKVNGKIVPLSYQLRSGDIVEVLTSKRERGPSRDWLALVKTTRARNKIKAWFKAESRKDSEHTGREQLQDHLRKQGLPAQKIVGSPLLADVIREMGFRKADDFYVALGGAKISAKVVVNKILRRLMTLEDTGSDAIAPDTFGQSRAKSPSYYGINVEGSDETMLRLAKCCRPVLGDPIVGYISLGQGITIHREDCPNVAVLKKDPERFTPVAWDGDPETSFRVEIEVDGWDRHRLFEDMSRTFAEAGINILEARCTVNHPMVKNRFVVEVEDMRSLDATINRLRNVDAVFDAYRVTPRRRS